MEIIFFYIQVHRLDHVFGIGKIANMAFFRSARSIRTAILMIDQYCFFYAVESARRFNLALNDSKLPDPTCPRDTIITLYSEALREPVVQELLQTKIYAMDDYGFTSMYRHGNLL